MKRPSLEIKQMALGPPSPRALVAALNRVLQSYSSMVGRGTESPGGWAKMKSRHMERFPGGCTKPRASLAPQNMDSGTNCGYWFSSSPKDTREMEVGYRPFIQGNADLLPPFSAAALSVTTSQTKAKPLQYPQGKQLSPNHTESAVTPLPHSLCLQ